MITSYRDVVLGSSFDAVLFAFINHYPIFFDQPQRPFRFDYMAPEAELDSLKLPRQKNVLSTFEGDQITGMPKDLVWERMLFLLSLDGLAPLAGLCTSIRHYVNSFHCFNEYSKICDVYFDKLYDFTQKPKNKKYVCYDWIAFNSGGKHEIDFIETEDKFVKEIWFYSSDRICGNTKVKDACAVSFIDGDKLEEFDLSETMARFKVIKEMEGRGMRGLLNGYDHKGRPKHYKFKTSTINRTKELFALTFCVDQHNIELEIPSQKEMISQISEKSRLYKKYLKHL